MKTIKQLVLASILVLFTTAVFAETKMRITLQLPLKAHLGQNLLVFKKEVEKRSDIKVEIYDSAQLYKDSEVPQAVGSGAIEAGVASITRYAGTNPEVDIFYLPFLFYKPGKLEYFFNFSRLRCFAVSSNDASNNSYSTNKSTKHKMSPISWCKTLRFVSVAVLSSLIMYAVSIPNRRILLTA